MTPSTGATAIVLDFEPASVLVDNESPSWVYFKDADHWVPPFYKRHVFQWLKKGRPQQVTYRSDLVPSGQPPQLLSGEPARIRFTDEVLVDAPGVPFSAQSTSPQIPLDTLLTLTNGLTKTYQVPAGTHAIGITVFNDPGVSYNFAVSQLLPLTSVKVPLWTDAGRQVSYQAIVPIVSAASSEITISANIFAIISGSIKVLLSAILDPEAVAIYQNPGDSLRVSVDNLVLAVDPVGQDLRTIRLTTALLAGVPFPVNINRVGTMLRLYALGLFADTDSASVAILDDVGNFLWEFSGMARAGAGGVVDLHGLPVGSPGGGTQIALYSFAATTVRGSLLYTVS